MTPVYHRLQNEEHLIIRPIAPEDDAALAAIRHLLHQQFAPPASNMPAPEGSTEPTLYETFAATEAPQSDRGYWVLVDERDHRVVGGMGVAPRQEEPREGICELQHLYLHPQLHGRNVGRKLVEYCMQEAGKLGYRQIYLESGSPAQNDLNLNKNSGLRFFRSGRTVKITGITPSE